MFGRANVFFSTAHADEDLVQVVTIPKWNLNRWKKDTTYLLLTLQTIRSLNKNTRNLGNNNLPSFLPASSW